MSTAKTPRCSMRTVCEYLLNHGSSDHKLQFEAAMYSANAEYIKIHNPEHLKNELTYFQALDDYIDGDDLTLKDELFTTCDKLHDKLDPSVYTREYKKNQAVHAYNTFGFVQELVEKYEIAFFVKKGVTLNIDDKPPMSTEQKAAFDVKLSAALAAFAVKVSAAKARAARTKHRLIMMGNCDWVSLMGDGDSVSLSDY